MSVKHRLLETSYKGAVQARYHVIRLRLDCFNSSFLALTDRGLRRLVETQSERVCQKVWLNFFFQWKWQAETLSQRAVQLVKGTKGEPKSHGIALHCLNVDSLSWNACKGYEAKALSKASEYPIWLRSLRSSLRTVTPSTWRRETGRSRTEGCRGMRNADSQNSQDVLVIACIMRKYRR